MDPTTEIAWNTIVELRKEIIGSQRIRSQMICFKVTFVSTAVGLILANKVGYELLAIPAFAAIFFDLLINSFSIAIKRNGSYCRKYIEPKIRNYASWPSKDPLWEEYLSRPENRQTLSMIGNLGLTFLALVCASVGLLQSSHNYVAVILLLFLSSIRLGFCVSKILFYFFVISFVPVRPAGKEVKA